MRIYLALAISLAACTDDSQPTTLEAPSPDLGVLCPPQCADPGLVLERLDDDNRFVQLPSDDGLVRYVTASRELPSRSKLCDLIPADSLFGAAVCDRESANDYIPIGECALFRFDLSDGRELFAGGCR